MRPFAATIIAFLGAFLASSPPAGAAEPSPVIARIVKSGTLRVGMSGNQPPLNFKSKSGRMMGLEVDVVRALAVMMGVEPKFVQKPFGELLPALEKGEFDLVISGMTITPARNMKVAFVGPYLLSGKSILTKSATLASADATEDLDRANLKLAALKGSTSEDFVEAFLSQAQLHSTEGYDEAVQMLLDGKVDAVVADYQACALQAFLHPKEGLITLEHPLTVEPLGIAVAPGDSLFLNLMENSLGALAASGLLEGLEGRWLRSGGWVDQLP
jgi:polar amino acid transport system substrate-binding protein